MYCCTPAVCPRTISNSLTDWSADRPDAGSRAAAHCGTNGTPRACDFLAELLAEVGDNAILVTRSMGKAPLLGGRRTDRIDNPKVER